MSEILDPKDLQIKNLAAQLDAMKQMYNEGTSSSLQLRSTVILLQQAHQEVSQKNVALTSELEKIKAELEVSKVSAAAH